MWKDDFVGPSMSIWLSCFSHNLGKPDDREVIVDQQVLILLLLLFPLLIIFLYLLFLLPLLFLLLFFGLTITESYTTLPPPHQASGRPGLPSSSYATHGARPLPETAPAADTPTSPWLVPTVALYLISGALPPQDACFVGAWSPVVPVPEDMHHGLSVLCLTHYVVEIYFLPLQGLDHDVLDLHWILQSSFPLPPPLGLAHFGACTRG